MTLRTEGLHSLEQIKAFLEGSAALGFVPLGREAVYDWLSAELRRPGYARRGRPAELFVRRYTADMSYGRLH